MRKLLLALTAIIGLLFIGTGTVQAEGSIRLYLDSKQLKPEVPPQKMNDVTMVPVRIISEELGAKVFWNDSDKKITIEKKSLIIVMHIDKSEVMVNGSPERLEKAPVLWEDNTLLPVRFISEKLGLKVSWDELTSSVSLYNPIQASGGSSKSADQPIVALPTPKPTGPASPTPKPVDTTVKPGAPTPIIIFSAPAASQTSNTYKTSPTPTPSTSGNGGIPEVTKISLDGDILRVTGSSGSLEPKVSSMSGPDRLIIDLPNVTLSKTINGKPAVQNGEMAVSHPLVNKIRYSLYQENLSTVRIVVDLKQKIEYNLLESKNPGELALSLKLAKFIVVLDAGHGGKDSGAVSVKGRYEKDFNLSVVLQVAKLLENISNFDVRLTRNDDTFIELNDRVALANDLNADVFVSVHANKATKASVNGVETYYTWENSAALAALLHQNILAATGSSDRKVRIEEFRVTKATVMPAVLCEVGYLSNIQEEEQLYNEKIQADIAESIAATIKKYLQIHKE